MLCSSWSVIVSLSDGADLGTCVRGPIPLCVEAGYQVKEKPQDQGEKE